MDEFCLSDKIEENDEDIILEYNLDEDEKEWIYSKDVKEFIKKVFKAVDTIKDEIDKQFVGKIVFELAGEKLT